MKSFVIDGGIPLSGTVSISGAKNAALPACVAALLTEETVTLHAVPQLRDVSTILFTLGALGKRVVRHEESVAVAAGGPLVAEANAYSVRQMRASFLVLGPLIARLGEAIVPLPGGCEIGSRPVDLHLEGLRALGAQVEVRDGMVFARADGLRGSVIRFPFPSVGATEQVLMAAALARGATIVENAAVEPEVIDLVRLLRQMGAEISVHDRTIRVEGRPSLNGAEHTLIPDRMEAGTMLLAGAITRGEVTATPACPDDLASFLDCLKTCGVRVHAEERTISIDARDIHPKGIQVKTAPHPQFPTDLHPPMTAFLSTASGPSTVTESVFERRFAYVAGLCSMGARIVQDGEVLHIEGVSGLSGRDVEAPDIRGGAALVLAGLAAQGRTSVGGLDHIDRGHEDLDAKLRGLGARIERREESS